MTDTPARLLRLLSLLQARPTWTAPELAERLEVTDRTVRRDVTRLRDLGYPVDAEPGPHGGYQLGRGGSLPPLLLDDDEAVAVALGLRAAADGSVTGLDDATVSALAKLEQVLPAPLVERVRSIQEVTTSLHGRDPDQVDAGLLVELAQACRQSERVRLGYVDRAGTASERRVDPYRLVRMGPRWYLVARDVDKDEWRTLRVDRITELGSTRHPVELVDPPDPVELVQRANAVAPYSVQGTVRLPVALATAQGLIARTVGVHRADGADATLVEVGGSSIGGLARFLVGLGVPFTVVDPPALRAEVHALATALVEANA